VGPDAHVSLPAATGPFVVDEWTPGVGIDLSKHQDYWKEGRPYADFVEMRVITETRTRLAALETGQLNVAWLQAEMVPKAKEDPDIQVWANPGVGWDGWYWSTGLPPFDDFRIRQATIKAVDRKAVNNSIYLNTLMNHNAYAYSPDTSPFGVDLTDVWEGAMKYDPPAAKALVEEYAAEKGLSLPIEIKGVCERRPDRQQFCEFLQAAWGDIGLKFEFIIVPAAADRARVMHECLTHVTQTGSTLNPLGTTLDSALGSWANNNYAANPCKDKGQALGPENQAIQDSIDAELKAASATTDPALQSKAYQNVQRIALENAWIYNPSMHRVNYMGCYTPNTGGCDTNPFWAHGFWHTQDFWTR
jgi:ABC-type transport system substrate-binding protein